MPAYRSDLPFVPAADRAAREHDTVSFEVDGEVLVARRGETIATALLRHGRLAFGPHPVTREPVGPLCLMGSCFGCLCEIDGRPGSQACLEVVRDGLIVRTRIDT